MQVSEFGIDGIYVHDPKSFSLPAFHSELERQREPDGTPARDAREPAIHLQLNHLRAVHALRLGAGEGTESASDKPFHCCSDDEILLAPAKEMAGGFTGKTK